MAMFVANSLRLATGVGAAAAFGSGDADREQSLPVHVAEILDRERRRAIVLGSARRQHAPTETARPGDQIRLRSGEPERIRCKQRSVDVVRVKIFGRHHRDSMQQIRR